MGRALDRYPGPLFYAPKWVRDDRRVQELIEEIQELIAKPEFRRPSPVNAAVPRSFQPALIPEVASVTHRRPHLGTSIYFSLVVAVVAIAGAFGASTFPSAGTMATAAERSNETPLREQDANVAEARPVSAGLSINQRTPRNQGEEFPLAVTVLGSVAGASVIIDGLATGSTMTVGLPLGTNGWQLAAADLDKALVRPPEDFVGPMDVVLELRLADNTLLDRKALRLEWVAAAPKQSIGYPIRQLDRQEIADLIKRGEGFIAAGDLASARLVLQRAAEAGDSQAALMLAGTYDPILLEKIGIQGFSPDIIRGFAPDIALARTWYEWAKQFGSKEAVRRLEMLASRDRRNAPQQ
jgi:TPR repeat protein